jgi:hypothetical protein
MNAQEQRLDVADIRDRLDAFDRLVRVLSDPVATSARLAELRTATEALAAAETSLAAERARHEQAVVVLEERRARLQDEKLELRARRGELDHLADVLGRQKRELERSQRAHFGPEFSEGSSIVRGN